MYETWGIMTIWDLDDVDIVEYRIRCWVYNNSEQREGEKLNSEAATRTNLNSLKTSRLSDLRLYHFNRITRMVTYPD